MSDKKILFRKSMSGYNREDVNNYIEAMNKKYNDEKTEYAEKLEALEKENKQFTENELPELEELRAEREQREALVAEMTETIEKLRMQIEQASIENARLSDRVSELEKTNDANMEVYEKSSINTTAILTCQQSYVFYFNHLLYCVFSCRLYCYIR